MAQQRKEQHVTTQWRPQLDDVASHYNREAQVWRAWQLRDVVGSPVYAFWDNGVVSTYSQQGILQKRWRVHTGEFF